MRVLPRIVILLTAGAGLAGCTKARSTTQKEEEIKPVATLTADQLVEEYKQNQIGADGKYKDKLVQVTGKVAGIGKLPLAGYYIDLGSTQEGDLFGIKCILDKNDAAAEAKAGTLKEGDTITIAGRCEGKAVGQALYLRYCYFPAAAPAAPAGKTPQP
jgi:hypothetical protein